jgi:hypothetical protein
MIFLPPIPPFKGGTQNKGVSSERTFYGAAAAEGFTHPPPKQPTHCGRWLENLKNRHTTTRDTKRKRLKTANTGGEKSSDLKNDRIRTKTRKKSFYGQRNDSLRKEARQRYPHTAASHASPPAKRQGAGGRRRVRHRAALFQAQKKRPRPGRKGGPGRERRHFKISGDPTKEWSGFHTLTGSPW